MSRLELTGQKFGRLTVDSYAFTKKYKTYWNCTCECGNKCIVVGTYLTTGETKSCGCLKIDICRKAGLNSKKYNTYYVDKNKIVHVKLRNVDEEMLCDVDDWEKLKTHCWYKDSQGYARTTILTPKKSSPAFHTLIFTPKEGEEIDHISRNKLDNRKSNLRSATRSQNMQNKDIISSNTSGITGVRWHSQSGNWAAQINVNKKRINLGYFKNKEDAIKAREEAEVKYFGEFRRTENREEVSESA